MPVAEEQREQERDEQEHGLSGSGAKSALTSAAVAAATGAAVYGVRKALTRNGGDSGRRSRDDREDDGGGRSSGISIVGSAASSAWDSASHAILPMAEDAAGAAGKWVAEHAPDVVKERIVPRFIESFNDTA
jgi:hypothetical protein